MQRDKVSLDIFWLKDESLEDTDNLPEPGRAGARDRGEPAGGAGAVQRDRGGAGEGVGILSVHEAVRLPADVEQFLKAEAQARGLMLGSLIRLILTERVRGQASETQKRT